MEATELMRVIVAEQPKLLAIARRLARQDGEDLLSDTVERLMTRAHQCDGTNVVGWVATAMKNLHLNNVRHARCGEAVTDRVKVNLVAARADDYGNAETVVLARLERERIANALAALPDAFREVVTLVLVDDLPCTTVAETLNIPVNTVYTRLSRGKRLLRESLAA